MIKKSRRFSSTITTMLAIATIAATQWNSTSPASAAAPTDQNVSGSVQNQGTGNVVTGNGNQDGAGNPTLKGDFSWKAVRFFYDKPCVDINGNKSYAGIIEKNNVQVNTDCVVRRKGSADVTGVAKQAIPAPKPSADFTGNFLTGAEVAFHSTDVKNYTVQVPNFPGAQITITALKITWNFGDGASSSDPEPKHTYENIAPNQNKKDLHKVHVTVTGTWRATLLDAVGGGTEDLGTFTGTGSIDRQLVQVWSKQTEPNS